VISAEDVLLFGKKNAAHPRPAVFLSKRNGAPGALYLLHVFLQAWLWLKADC
jgi:hypothetical protein